MAESVNTNQQLAEYIKKNISKGYTMDSLRFALVRQGYSRTSVEKAIELANKQLASSAPKMTEQPVVKYEIISDEDMKKKVAEQDASEGFFSKMKRKIFG